MGPEPETVLLDKVFKLQTEEGYIKFRLPALYASNTA